MTDKIGQLCMGCMTPLEPGRAVCPRCSYDNSIPNPRGTLPAGTVLGDGYIVGRVVRQNDLTITYLGLHQQKNIKVYVEEFFPRSLADRDLEARGLTVAEENRIRYKTLYSDIADRWKRLSKFDSRNAVKVRELFSEGGTIYCVSSYMPYHTLEQQLEEHGVYSWAEAKAAFMPLFAAVSNLHNQGLTHCGVSPENIIVNRRGELILVGFALPELRTEGGGLTPELYSGYSAPEQYSRNLWQGEWTDVYSLGAVLYHALTGIDPAPALERSKKDTMREAAAINTQIPSNVSEALTRALESSKQKRFQTVDDFTAALLAEKASNTAVFRPEPAKPDPKPTEPPAYSKKGMVVASLGVALLLSITANAVLSARLFAPPPQPSESISAVPVVELMPHRFVGIYYDLIGRTNELYSGLTFQAEKVYNEEYPKGVVFAQSIQPGDPMPEDHIIRLSVSRGSKYVDMPDIIGSSDRFARKALTDLDIRYNIVYDYNPDTLGEIGTVVDTNKGFDVKVARETELVTITVKRAASEAPVTIPMPSSTS
ncbi:MAG: protein kinase [Angelakisella sp.]